jgi:hypothetical protein
MYLVSDGGKKKDHARMRVVISPYRLSITGVITVEFFSLDSFLLVALIAISIVKAPYSVHVTRVVNTRSPRYTMLRPAMGAS